MDHEARIKALRDRIAENDRRLDDLRGETNVLANDSLMCRRELADMVRLSELEKKYRR